MRDIKADITIVGAGLVGSALALWLAKHSDYSIALLERNEPLRASPDANQRVVALGTLATDLLDDLDVLSCLGEAHSHSYSKMRVWDENSDGELVFDAEQAGLNRLGHMIDSQMCAYRLQQAALDSRVDCHFNMRCNELYLNADAAVLEADLGRISSRLVVAADGGRSWVRQQAKIFANYHHYDQRGIVTTIETEKSHQDCAWQCFLATGPVAVLPLSQNRSSIVWSADNALADELLTKNDQQFSDALSGALQGRLGSVKTLAKRQAFPLLSSQAERYYKRRLALVGDAAHSIHPLAGQGANLGFKDALTLGKLLVSVDREELGSPRVLSKYQAKRLSDNTQTDMLMTALHHAYRLDWPAWMLVRGLGMNLINDSSLLRDALTRQALGL